MRKKHIRLAIILLLFLTLTSTLLWKTIFKQMYLFPGNYLIAWFEPYRSENFIDGTILIAHKPILDDVFRHIYPFQLLAVEQMKNFRPPLWNPYNGAGQPLLATINSAMLDPANILYLIFPDLSAWNLKLYFQYILIGIFTYLYSRSVKFGRLSSVFTAVIYMVSGFTTIRIGYGVYGYAIASLPFLLYIIESYFKNKYTKKIFLIPVALLFLITASQTPVVVYVLGFCAIYFLTRLNSLYPDITTKIRIAIIPLIAVIFGILITAVQLLPTFELYKNANLTTESSKYIEKFLVPPEHLLTLFIPNFFGNPATYNYWGSVDYIQTILYLGLIPSYFAFLFLTSKEKSGIGIKKIYSYTVLASVLFAVSSPVSKFILTLPIPIISTDPPSRIFILTTFAITILAGAGFNTLFSTIINLKALLKKSLTFLILVFILISLALYLNFQPTLCPEKILIPCNTILFRNTLLETAIFIFGFTLLIFYSISKFKNSKYFIPGLIILLVFLVGFYNAQKFLPMTTKDRVFPETDLIKAIKDRAYFSRIFGFEDANITTNFATYFKFYDPQYYHPLNIRRYAELTAFSNSGKIGKQIERSDSKIENEILLPPEENARRNRLLSLTNTEFLIINKNQDKIKPEQKNIVYQNEFHYLTKNPDALPRAYLAAKPQVIREDEKILKTLFDPNFDHKNSVILEEHVPGNYKQSSISGSVKITAYRPDLITLKTQSASDSILVLSDNYYPGWIAFVDNKPVPIMRANYSFRALPVPAGNHEVSMIYDPLSFKSGLYISILTTVVLILLFLNYQKITKRIKNLVKFILHT